MGRKPNGDAEQPGQTDLLGLPEAQPEAAPRAEVTTVTSDVEPPTLATVQPVEGEADDQTFAEAGASGEPDVDEVVTWADLGRTDGKRGDDGHGNVRPADSRFTQE